VKEMRSCSLPVFSARLMLLKCRLSQITNAWFRADQMRAFVPIETMLLHVTNAAA
jgi:hypothetical protein